jgi:hypothetical protein
VFGYSQNLTVFHHCLAFIKKDQNQKKNSWRGGSVIFCSQVSHHNNQEKKRKEDFVANAF